VPQLYSEAGNDAQVSTQYQGCVWAMVCIRGLQFLPGAGSFHVRLGTEL
jgi:hypothetical protein